MLSGEAHYRLERDEREPYYELQRAKHPSLEAFFTFLDSDVCPKTQTRLYTSRLTKIRANKSVFLRSYKQRCKLEADLLVVFVRLHTKRGIAGAMSVHEKLKTNLLREQSSLDSFLMSSVLQYYSLLREELRRTRELLLADRLDGDVLRLQAAAVRDMRVLAKHLEVETKERVSISLLAQDSVQAQRCRSAVRENFQGSGEARVLNVFKVDHSVLQAQLQQVASSVEHGTIKGLFCYVSPDALAAFCSFGLDSQHFCSGGAGALPSLFRLPWFCYDNSANLSASLPGAEKAARKHQADKLTFYFSKQSLSPSPRTSSSSKAGGKLSTSDGVRDTNRCSAEEAAVGAMVALCRVLICRLRTIAGEITTAEIEEGRSLGCDALFSSQTEEYVFLRPEYVLPEFLLHTQVIAPGAMTAAASGSRSSGVFNKAAPRVRSWLPLALECGAPATSVVELLCRPPGESDGNGCVGGGGAEVMARKQALIAGIEGAIHSYRQGLGEDGYSGARR